MGVHTGGQSQNVSTASGGFNRSGMVPKVSGPRPSMRFGGNMHALHGKEDTARERVLRTPRVFQSSTASHHRQRELRSNLLPSIMWAPLDKHGIATDDEDRKMPELMGDFHKQYQQELESRAKAEEETAVFLERDPAATDADRDPVQIIAGACSVLKDLVANKLSTFRRAQQCFIKTSSELPFMNKDQSLDLEELSHVFTLDLERIEYNFKDSVKRPGFLSLQLTSRLPLLVTDPFSDGRKMEGERLDQDLHTLRLDLQNGEVRHVSFSLDNHDFKDTDLAKRMSAVINPEKSVIAQLVRTLRAKESEAKVVNNVLGDILRDLPDALPPASEPTLASGIPESEAKAQRFKDVTELPRRTMQQLLEVVEKLAALAAPLVPSLSHALDRMALISVREVDRLLVKYQQDYEHMLEVWSKTEAERCELVNAIDRMGGKADGSGGVELRNRVGKLHSDLIHQEKLYSELLTEYRAHLVAAEESHRVTEGLRSMVHELQGQVTELQRHRRRDREGIQSQLQNSDNLKPSHGRSPPCERMNLEAPQIHPQSPPKSPKELPTDLDALKSFAEGLFAFSVPVATQTPNNHFFNDNCDLADELSFADFEETMVIANRVYGILSKYEWNPVAARFFLKPIDEDSDTEPAQKEEKDAPPVDARLAKMLALKSLKVKVERAHARASYSMIEEENFRLQACAKEGFEAWVAKERGQLGIKKAGTTVNGTTLEKDEPVKPDELWAELEKAVHNEGLNARIRELEEQLSSLLPLAERARGGEAGADGGSDSLFWKRVMKQVKQSTSPAYKKEAIRRQTQARASEAEGHAAQFFKKRRSSGGEAMQMDVPRLLAELASIWASLISQKESHETHRAMISGRIPTHQVLQACIKTFYLRKSGRSKFVEAAVVQLCKSVYEGLWASPKILLFAIMTDIQSPDALAGKLPAFSRKVDLSTDVKTLRDLPLDAAYVMANFMRELKTLRRSKKYSLARATERDRQSKVDGGWIDTGDHQLPIKLLLAAGHTCICGRSRTTSMFFYLALLGFAEFHPRLTSRTIIAQLLEPTSEEVSGSPRETHNSADKGSPTPGSPRSGRGTPGRSSLTQEEVEGGAGEEAADRGGSRSPRQGRERPTSELDKQIVQEMMFISQLINMYVWQRIDGNASVGIVTTAQTNEEKEHEVLTVLWNRLVEQAASVSGIRRALGLTTEGTCTGKGVAECLVKWGVVPLPVDVVLRTIRLLCGASVDSKGEVQMDEDMFMHYCKAHRFCGEDGGVSCRESIVLWAGMWALSNERQHELSQMGVLFELYDTSGDGWLQFDEFAQFVKAVAPGISNEEAEELFLCGAEEAQGDMTKEVFLSLVLRLGITSDIDTLDELISRKKPLALSVSVISQRKAQVFESIRQTSKRINV